jgi:hypothetical protein
MQLDDKFIQHRWYDYDDDDNERLSECCGSSSKIEIIDGLGLCSDCGEWAGFFTEEELDNEID